MQGPLLLFLIVTVIVVIIIITIICYYGHLLRHTGHFLCLPKCQHLFH